VKILAQNFQSVFGIGFAVLIFAVSVGAASGQVWSDNPALTSLRFWGMGVMLAGVALWVALRRDQGRRPGLNPVLGLLAACGLVLLLIGVAIGLRGDRAPTELLRIGLGLSAAAAGLGVLSMFVSPPDLPPRPFYPWMRAGAPESVHTPYDDVNAFAADEEAVEEGASAHH
jgi:hypothetical protein